MSMWLEKLLIIFNLLQIFHLLGVGLLLIFDLLACVDSTGMLYHNSAKFCARVLHMWQSRVEIEHYSVAYFARIASFEAL